MKTPNEAVDELTYYILEFLRTRNDGELREAFESMRVKDFNLMREELALILTHGGKPPNWVK